MTGEEGVSSWLISVLT